MSQNKTQGLTDEVVKEVASKLDWMEIIKMIFMFVGAALMIGGFILTVYCVVMFIKTPTIEVYRLLENGTEIYETITNPIWPSCIIASVLSIAFGFLAFVIKNYFDTKKLIKIAEIENKEKE